MENRPTGQQDKNGIDIGEGDTVSGFAFIRNKFTPFTAKVIYLKSSVMFKSEFKLENVKDQRWVEDVLLKDIEVVNKIQ